MEDVILLGTVPTNRSVGAPGFKESLIPLWGPGRAAVNHLQLGNYGRATLYTALAITDVFLVKSLATVGGRLIVKGATGLFTKGSEKLLEKVAADMVVKAPSLSISQANQLVMKVGSAEFKNLGSRIAPGVQLAQVDGWFVKKINPAATWFRREWGGLSIEAQQQALAKLGSEIAPEFFIHNGMLFTKSVGATSPKFFSGTFWGGYFKGSIRMRTFLNDIRLRNMGVNGMIFDPALDPLMKSIFWSGVDASTVPARVILRDQ
jgi:hypothetical protein